MTTLTLESLRSQTQCKKSCKMDRILTTLSEDDQGILNTALSSPEGDFPSGRISSVLAALNLFVTTDTIIKHRRGLCGCAASRG